MTESDICIACLGSDIKMHCIKNTELAEIFENLTNNKLSALDGISESLCYICCSQLKKCWRFIKMSQKAGEVLMQLHIDKVQISKDTVSVFNKEASYVTVMQQSSISSPDVSVKYEEARCCTDEGVFKGPDIPMKNQVAVKEEPTDIDGQITIVDDFIAIKHEPMESIVDNMNKHSCEHENKESNIKPMKDIKCILKSQIENNQLATETSPKSETYCNSDDNKRKFIKKRIRNKSKRKHICNVCQNNFSCHAYLIRHIRTHTGEKPYTCDNCGKTFSQNGHLIQHMRLHTGEKPYACHICKNKEFNHRYNYKSHMKKHFGKPSHTCDLCKSSFHQKGDLKRHMMSHTGEKPYTCDICSVKFTQRCHLTKHLRIHTKEPYSCQYCKETFIHQSDLKDHLITHKETEMFPCPYEGCSKYFNKEITLNNHFQSHIKGRSYPCKKCKRTFKQKGHLTKHIITVHDNAQSDELQKLEINVKQDQDKLKSQNKLRECIEEYIIP